MMVTTNNAPREILDSNALTTKEREQFNYFDWTALDEGTDSASFFRYRGEIYDLGTFMRTGDPHWHGIACDSMSTATVVHVTNDGSVIVGFATS